MRALFDLESLEGSARRIEIGHVVSGLSHKPNLPLLVDIRIAWTRIRPGDLPLGNLKRRLCRALRGNRDGDNRKRDCREKQITHDAPEAGTTLSLSRRRCGCQGE